MDYFAITQTLPSRAEAYMHCIFEMINSLFLTFLQMLKGILQCHSNLIESTA